MQILKKAMRWATDADKVTGKVDEAIPTVNAQQGSLKRIAR